MAGSLHLQTLALMGRQFLAQALANGGSLDSAAQLMPQPGPFTTGREKAAAALTGRIRSDAATLMQSAKNALEGAAMSSMIKESALSLGETLSGMQTVVQSYASGQMDETAAQELFASLAGNLSAGVSGTRYNGISLMDQAGWDDERLTVTGDTATLSIQMGGASTFSLRDFSSLKSLETVDLADENAADALASLMEDLSTRIATVNTVASGYEALASSYASQAKSLENQAAVLAKTAARAIAEAGKHPADVAGPDPEKTLAALLLDMLLRDSGRVVDTSS